MIEIEFKCISGSARVYTSRDAEPTVLRSGQSLVLPVVDTAAMPYPASTDDEDFQEQILEWVKRNFATAWNAPAIGADRRNSGQVSATPKGCDMVIREYVETNAFLEPDKPDHVDHVAADGEPVLANTTRSNVVTLMPTRPV